ncbi:MAG: hypothetical protein WBQ20_01490, partial [Methyloceanibacter sp.]
SGAHDCDAEWRPRIDHNDASALISWHIPQRGILWQTCCPMRRARKALVLLPRSAAGGTTLT